MPAEEAGKYYFAGAALFAPIQPDGGVLHRTASRANTSRRRVKPCMGALTYQDFREETAQRMQKQKEFRESVAWFRGIPNKHA